MDDTTRTQQGGGAPALRLDRLCDRFEAEWRDGRRPDAAAYLAEAAEPDRPRLLRELLALELELRAGSGERPTPEEYRARFPQHTALIDAVFGEATAADAGRLAGSSDRPVPDGPTRTAAPGESPPAPMAADAGRFPILRPHARGGLGEVFVARDEALHREVALKRIQGRFADDPRSRARFLAEAEITGRLEHPGIVPVHALGVADDGRPFYVMKFIRGESLREAIHRFHADEGGDPAGRAPALRLLRRLIDACNAVAYAHSRGILHRDLKPANILLGAFGETLVIDWGLAKPLDGDAAGPSVAAESEAEAEASRLRPTLGAGPPTAPGSPLGTPAYMSPEQAAGRPEEVGPASDVYGLGATLYVLLTGRAPFDAEGELGDLLRRVREGAFAPPRRVRPEVHPALEAICLKAMAREPGRRYESARALAEDLERWLADEPVSARREPWTTRARRRLARHRTALIAVAASVLVALIGLAAALALQAQANRRERAALELAQAQLDLAMEAIERYYTGVSEEVLLKEPRFEELRKTLLAAPLGFYEKQRTILERIGARDPATQSRLAEAYFRLGTLTDKIGRKEDALRSYHRALALRERLAATDPRAARPLADVGQACLALGNLYRERKQGVEAARFIERAVAIYERLTRAEPRDEAHQDALAHAYTHLGILHREAGRQDEALNAYRRALPLRERLAGAHPDSKDFGRAQAGLYNNIANAHGDQGQTREAIDALRRAIAVAERLAAADPDASEIQARLGQYYTNLALYQRQSDPDAAIRTYRSAVAHARRAAEASPTVTAYQNELARTHYQLGYMLRKAGLHEESLDALEQAAAARRRLAEANPSIPGFRADLAYSLGTLGNFQADLGRFDEARESYREAIAAREELVRQSPAAAELRGDLARSYGNMATLFLPDALDRPEEALAWCHKAIALQEGLVEALPDEAYLRNELALSRSNLGLALRRLGRLEEAITSLRRAVEDQRQVLARRPNLRPSIEQLDRFLRGLAATLRELGRAEEAAEATRERIGLWPDDPAKLFDAACELALCIPIARSRGAGPALSEEIAAAAVEALARAVAAGWADVARITREPDLEPLRGRADYRRLLVESFDRAFPSDPFAW